MKTQLRYFAFFFALAFSFPLSAQSSDYISYNTSFGDVHHMIRTSDGGLAMMLAGMDQNPTIMKTTSTGAISWQQKITFSGASVMFQLAETNDQGIVALTSDNTGGIVIFKLNSAGVYQWMKRYNYSASNQGWSLVGNDVGGVLIVGNGCAGNNFAIYTDASGNISWSKQYIDPNYSGSTGTCVIKVSNTEYVVTGLLLNSSQQATFLMSISNTGALNWFKEYSFGGSNPSGSKRVIKTADGGYSVTGYVTLSGVMGSYVIHTNSTGVISWSKTYFFTLDSSPTDIIQESDNSYIVGGSGMHSGNFYVQELLMHIDVNGNLLWARSDGNSYYQQAGYDGFSDLEYNSGNRFFASGASDGMILYTMTDSVGFCHSVVETPTVASGSITTGTPTVSPSNITFTTTAPTATGAAGPYSETVICTHPVGIEEAQNNSGMSVFPNPATQSCSVMINNASLENATLTITDLLGNVVHEERIPAIHGTTTLTIPLDFASGMYVMHIDGDGAAFSSPLIVE